MTELQLRAVRQALHTLTVMKVPFAAMLPSGKVGDLEVAPDKAVKEPKRRLFNHVDKHRPRERIRDMAEGSELQFVVSDYAEAKSLRSTLVAGAVQQYGNQCCMSSIEKKPDGYHVTLLLVTKNGVAG